MHLSPTLSLLTLYLVSSSIGTTTALVVRRRSTPPSTTPTTTTTTTTTPTPRYASKRLIGTKCDPAVIQQLCLDRDHHYLWCNVETLKWTSGYFADGFGPNGCQPVQHQTSTFPLTRFRESRLRPVGRTLRFSSELHRARAERQGLDERIREPGGARERGAARASTSGKCNPWYPTVVRNWNGC